MKVIKHKIVPACIALLVAFTLFSCHEEWPSNGNEAGKQSEAATTDYYYWYYNKKIMLSSLPDLYYFSSSDSLEMLPARLEQQGVFVHSTLQSGSYIQQDEKIYWKIVDAKVVSDFKLKLNEMGICVAPVFGKDKQNSIATNEIFYVKLKSPNDIAILQEVANQFACKVVEPFKFTELWFVLKAPVTSNGLLMANAFYETGKFEITEPVFMFNFGPDGSLASQLKQ